MKRPRRPALFLRRREHRPGNCRPPGTRPLPGGPVSVPHVLRGRPLHGLVRRGRSRDPCGRPRLAPVRLPLHPPLLSFRISVDAALGLALFNAVGLVVILYTQGPPGRSGAAGAGGGGAVPGRDRGRDEGERLRVMLECVGDGVIVTDAEGRVAMINPAAECLLGWSSADAAGRPLAEVFRRIDGRRGPRSRSPPPRRCGSAPPSDHRGLAPDRQGRDGQADRRERRPHPRSGRRDHWPGRHLPGRDRSQAGGGGAREADRRKDEFLATLAHELRNPLAPIRNGLQILKHTEGDNPAVEPLRAMMERQVKHLARLVDDLLDVSRITTGRSSSARRWWSWRRSWTRRSRRTARRSRAGARVERRRPRRGGAARGRPDPPGAGPLQPADQRRQVHRPGGAHLARRPQGGGRGRHPRRRHGHRHRPGDAAACLRPVRAGRAAAGPLAGRPGHRPDPGEEPRGDARRHASRPTATGRARAASSSSACPRRGRDRATARADRRPRRGGARRAARRILVVDDNQDAADSLAST